LERAHEPLVKGLGDGAKGLLRSAVAALARREYARAELERKLRRDLQSPQGASDIAAVLDRLQARGLLSDERMAQEFVRTHAARYGRARIECELERRGVDRGAIAAALSPVTDEFAAALALWQRKFGRAAATMRERARQSRFLAARGFAPAARSSIHHVSEAIVPKTAKGSRFSKVSRLLGFTRESDLDVDDLADDE